jgi:hypothetical protein
MKQLLFVIFMALLLQGCVGLGHKNFYTQVAPVKYPPNEKTMVFEYSDVKLKEIYDLLFSDFLVIGRSGFNGPYEDPSMSIMFAHSIGADVFISSAQFKETMTSFVNLSTPTSNTTYISGYSGTGSFYGTATTYGTRTTAIPISVDRYNQFGLYLRNINNVVPLWERTEGQYKKTKDSDLNGVWFNLNYKLNLYRSGDQLVAFVAENPKGEDRSSWSQGQLKFIYGVESGVGVYLMGNKTPMPAEFKLNKFGHLEVTIITSKDTFSFAR